MQNRKTSRTFMSIILPDLHGGFSCVSNFGGFWVLSITLKIRKFRSRNKWNALIRVEILRSKWSTTLEEQEGILFTHASIWAVEGPQRHFL